MTRPLASLRKRLASAEIRLGIGRNRPVYVCAVARAEAERNAADYLTMCPADAEAHGHPHEGRPPESPVGGRAGDCSGYVGCARPGPLFRWGGVLMSGERIATLEVTDERRSGAVKAFH
jgi:hypothetical protein